MYIRQNVAYKYADPKRVAARTPQCQLWHRRRGHRLYLSHHALTPSTRAEGRTGSLDSSSSKVVSGKRPTYQCYIICIKLNQHLYSSVLDAPRRTSTGSGAETPPTPLFDEDVSQPLEDFPRTKYSGPGWEMHLRQPNKKKITGQR